MLAYLSALWTQFKSEAGQDTFEYVLIIGGVVVAVIIAVATPIGSTLIDAVITAVCTAVDSIPGMSSIDCTTI